MKFKKVEIREKWTAQQTQERIDRTDEEIKEFDRDLNKTKKELNKIFEKQRVINSKKSNKVRYKNQLMQQLKEAEQEAGDWKEV